MRQQNVLPVTPVSLLLVITIALLSSGCGGYNRVTTSISVSNSPGPSPISNYGNVESTIVGEFDGWTGDTVFQLDNGQVWQQSSYAYLYHYAYRPSVLIYADGSSWKMKVDGVDDAIAVERLK